MFSPSLHFKSQTQPGPRLRARESPAQQFLRNSALTPPGSRDSASRKADHVARWLGHPGGNPRCLRWHLRLPMAKKRRRKKLRRLPMSFSDAMWVWFDHFYGGYLWLWVQTCPNRPGGFGHEPVWHDGVGRCAGSFGGSRPHAVLERKESLWVRRTKRGQKERSFGVTMNHPESMGGPGVDTVAATKDSVVRKVQASNALT